MSHRESEIQSLLKEISDLKEYKERLKLFEETSFEAITVYDENLRCMETNAMTTELFQYERDEVLGMYGLDFFAPSFRETALKSVQRKNREPYEALMARKDGTTFPALIQGTTLKLNGRDVRVSTCRDISDLEEIRSEARQKDEEFQAIFDTSPVGIFLMKEDRIIERANPSVALILGYDSEEELIGKNIRIIHLTDESYERFGEFYKTSLLNGETLRFDYQFRKKNGLPVWVSISGNTVDRSNPPDLNKGVVWSMDDISLRKAAEEELIRLSRTDPLTGICNRGYFMELAEREFHAHHRYNHPLSLMMLDIDRFKRINDTYGHSAGDKAICYLTDLCHEIIRETDVFGRLGGEEFSILLIEADKEEAWKIAERIRTELKARTGTEEEIPDMTVSIGLIILGPESLEEALVSADKLLYKAKNGGRDRTCS